jgi:hypothetical protein
VAARSASGISPHWSPTVYATGWAPCDYYYITSREGWQPLIPYLLPTRVGRYATLTGLEPASYPA